MKVGDCVRLTEKGLARMLEEWPPEERPHAVYPPAGAVGYVIKLSGTEGGDTRVRFIGGYHNGAGVSDPEHPPSWWFYKKMLELVT